MKRTVLRACLLVGCLAGLFPVAAAGERASGGYFNAARMDNVRRNVERYSWAASLRDRAVARAAPWCVLRDEEIWALVPGQDLPRCIDVTLTRGASGTTRAGCLQCGGAIDRFGSFPYGVDFTRQPWKITCPSCGTVFPTNDFAAYYRSGIDERGLFDPTRADRSLLFNTAHPDPRDPLHTWGVDDGLGYVAPDGQHYRFIGYYAWKYWRHLLEGLQALADAFVLTGETRYAHKAAILLDRIADVYPEMDWAPYAKRGWFHSDANRGVGKIEGAIWETNTARKLAESYDAILSGTVGDESLEKFLAQQGRRFHLPTRKGTRDLFVRNVDERVLRCIHDGILSGQIGGNEGMQQQAMAAAALALNTAPETTRWLEWLFEPRGGAIPGFIVSQFDRDGGSTEAAPNYALFAGMLFSRIAAKLEDYPLAPRRDLWSEFPQLRATFTLGHRLAVRGRAVPNLGDTGMTGLVTTAPGDAAFSALGFRLTGDPAMARAAVALNGGSADGLGRDVFAAEPEELERALAAAAQALAPHGGELLTGFGLARLEVGDVGVACNYGRTYFHGHADTLNFDLFAFGRWLAPDHGYPEFATNWPSRNEWTTNTLAHNTVFVDGQPQRRHWGGKAVVFRQLPDFAAVEIDGRAAYPTLERYARTLLLIGQRGGAGAYLVDIFRVNGGRDHVLSLHGPPGTVTTERAELAAPARGTYAGETVERGARADGFPPGYSYLYAVRRGRGLPGATIDWTMDPNYRGEAAGDAVHLRAHFPSGADELALARGDPPQNKEGNPRTLEYVLAHRAAMSPSPLASTFVTVLEPYRGGALIRSVQRLPSRDDQVALRIELTNGDIDYVCSNPDEHGRLSVPGLELEGRLGWCRESAGRAARAVAVDATEWRTPDMRLESRGAVTGRVVRMSRDLAGGGVLWIDTEIPAGADVVGQCLHVDNQNERDATYVIRGVSRDGTLTKLDCGPISFVRGYAGETMKLRGQTLPADYSRGYLYDFEPGAAFRIPLHAEAGGVR